MTDETTPTPAQPTRRTRRRTVLKVVLVSALVLALVTGVGTWLFVRHLDGNIETGSLAELGPGRPERQYTGNGKPLNILVMGDDSRDGEGNRIDGEEGAGGSDTTILVHLSADRSRAYAVSIPRDSIVDRPACNDGDTPAATRVMWNAAFTVGKEYCTADQFEQTTDILLDHYAVVDFNGFGQMVEAVGGVPVCVPEDIVDEERQIFVPAGDPSVLRGDQALDYFRARYVGEQQDQNDISRIRRQQEFIGALVSKVQSAGTLARPDRVVRFLDAATKSLRTDEELGSVLDIARIALQLRDIGLDKVQFVTLPTDYFPVDSELSGKVFWTPEAYEIWDLLNHDEVLPASLIGDSSVSAKKAGGKGGGKGHGTGGGGGSDEVFGICA
ncbi:LCP family protein [Nocardioides hwasunensis]|uniref:LCP family protein n=1 Tax=Nocardioides hwasunensis TaxID=397258 RepID=A0ABR8MJD3_9ACTN|nr:LCP family protein [Nocardioides hwasunensis]MBD3916153.1 LCP family protein [Nocardioides hwasunensis]